MSFAIFDEAINEALAKDPQEWGDYLVLEAEELVRSFNEQDWTDLRTKWKQRPEAWQLFCADALDCDQGIPMLVSMIIEASAVVALAAARSLQPVLTGRAERLAVSPEVVDRLRMLSVDSDQYLYDVFEKLVRVD